MNAATLRNQRQPSRWRSAFTSYPPQRPANAIAPGRLSVILGGGMPWVKIDADLQTHRKIHAVGPWGELLHVRAIGYARLHMTDGLIDAHAMRTLTIDFDPEVESAIEKKMIDAGLFDQDEKGVWVHDYSE